MSEVDHYVLSDLFPDPDLVAAKRERQRHRAKFNREFRRLRSEAIKFACGVLPPVRVEISLEFGFPGFVDLCCEVFPAEPGCDWCEVCGFELICHFERELNPCDPGDLDYLNHFFDEFRCMISAKRGAGFVDLSNWSCVTCSDCSDCGG
tara:strand:- start:1580 stop:2026 length:447 start_codon:yes stop_codon:yes gene_type:complete